MWAAQEILNQGPGASEHEANEEVQEDVLAAEEDAAVAEAISKPEEELPMENEDFVAFLDRYKLHVTGDYSTLIWVSYMGMMS